MRTLWPAPAAAVAAALVDGLYLWLIAAEGEGQLTSGRVLFVATSLGAAALALAAGVRARRPRSRAVAFGAAGATLAVWTVLGAFSIGILLLPAAILAILAADRAGASDWAFAAGGAALAVAALGLFLT